MGFNLADYEPVEDRLREFWERFPMGKVTTELLAHSDGDYIVMARVYRGDELRDGTPAATGLAHDSTAQLPANMKASALEVCETSAVGRALANLGFAPKGKRPSREEMQKASSPTTAPPVTPVAENPSDMESGGDTGGEGRGESSPSSSLPAQTSVSGTAPAVKDTDPSSEPGGPDSGSVDGADRSTPRGEPDDPRASTTLDVAARRDQLWANLKDFAGSERKAVSLVNKACKSSWTVGNASFIPEEDLELAIRVYALQEEPA